MYSDEVMGQILSENLSDINNALCKLTGIFHPIFPNRSAHSVENIFKRTPHMFHNCMKNPCFYQRYWVTIENERKNVKRLRCLPYFYIIGFPKCGTTDLWERLIRHPQIVAKHKKESHYIDDKRFIKQWTFEDYLKYFSYTSNEIAKQCEAQQINTGAECNIITGEATANTAAVNDLWNLLPENKGCTEPRFTNPDYLYSINPDMKLIALIRDPVERLWSDYHYLAKYFKYNTSREDFHEHAVNAIDAYKDCLKYFSPRGCAYNESIGSIQMRLRMALYDIHITDWLRVFPRQQLLIIRTEEYRNNTAGVLRRVFKHLNIDYPSTMFFEQMLMMPKENVNHVVVDMANTTRQMLYAFYKDSYTNVGTILQDPQFVLHMPRG